MSKLYLIVTLAGELAMSVGPLPYGPDECRERAQEKLEEINSDPAKRAIAEQQNIRIVCEYHDIRPTPKRGRP
jgi:hypothetical protein